MTTATRNEYPVGSLVYVWAGAFGNASGGPSSVNDPHITCTVCGVTRDGRIRVQPRTGIAPAAVQRRHCRTWK